jgi:hypothetical protein
MNLGQAAQNVTIQATRRFALCTLSASNDTV